MVIPGMAEKLRLQKFYDRLSESIRRIDPNRPICFAPTVYNKYTGVGYYHPPGGDNFRDKSILCYSFGRQNDKTMGLKALDAKRLKVPSLISQMYGGKRSFARAEGYGQSWFYFYYKDFGRNRT